jgi:hypothetical protein
MSAMASAPKNNRATAAKGIGTKRGLFHSCVLIISKPPPCCVISKPPIGCVISKTAKIVGINKKYLGVGQTSLQYYWNWPSSVSATPI